MVSANPGGCVYEMQRLRNRDEDDLASQTYLAKNIHFALVSILPAKRKYFDTRLESELHRLHLLGRHEMQLTSSKPVEQSEMTTGAERKERSQAAGDIRFVSSSVPIRLES